MANILEVSSDITGIESLNHFLDIDVVRFNKFPIQLAKSLLIRLLVLIENVKLRHNLRAFKWIFISKRTLSRRLCA